MGHTHQATSRTIIRGKGEASKQTEIGATCGAGTRELGLCAPKIETEKEKARWA